MRYRRVAELFQTSPEILLFSREWQFGQCAGMRLLKLLIGVLLLPACGALTMTGCRLAMQLTLAPHALTNTALWAFVAGVAPVVGGVVVVVKTQRQVVLLAEQTLA